MGFLTGGRDKVCLTDCSGGVDNIYIANKQDVIALTVVNDEVTAITMAATKTFFEFKAEEDTAEFKESSKLVGCANVVNQEIDMSYFCRSTADRKTLVELAKASCCGLVVIHKEGTGTCWIWGIDPTNLTSNRTKGALDTTTGTTGRLFEDQNKTDIAIKAKAKTFAYRFVPGTAGVPL